MKRLTVVFWLLIPAAALAWPWSRDMMDQRSVKPQEGEPVPFPQRSVPVGGYATPVTDRAEALKLANHVPATEQSVTRGAQYYAVFCVPCHGANGKGDGPVGRKLPVPPLDLTADFIQEKEAEGRIFGAITFGSAVMPSYRNDLTVEERWDIVNYIRSGLQSAGAPETL